MPWTYPEACCGVVVNEAWDDTQQVAPSSPVHYFCLSFVLI